MLFPLFQPILRSVILPLVTLSTIYSKESDLKIMSFNIRLGVANDGEKSLGQEKRIGTPNDSKFWT
jgi:hypothetical protein